MAQNPNWPDHPSLFGGVGAAGFASGYPPVPQPTDPSPPRYDLDPFAAGPTVMGGGIQPARLGMTDLADVELGPAAEPLSQPTDDLVQQSLLRDIDAIIARLEVGIAKENVVLDALLARLTKKAA